MVTEERTSESNDHSNE